MVTKSISRRELLNDAGVLLVSFDILDPEPPALAEQLPAPRDRLPMTILTILIRLLSIDVWQ